MWNPLKFFKSGAVGKTTENIFAVAQDDTAVPSQVTRAPGSSRRAQVPRGYGYRRLQRFKTCGNYRFQLHATRGWKCIGKVKP